jgi:hypothetical protein
MKNRIGKIFIMEVTAKTAKKSQGAISFKASLSADLAVGKEVEKATTASLRSVLPLWDEVKEIWSHVPEQVRAERWAVQKEAFEPFSEEHGEMTITCTGGMGIPEFPRKDLLERRMMKATKEEIEDAWKQEVAEFEQKKSLWLAYQETLIVLGEIAQRGIYVPVELNWRSDPAPGELPFPSASKPAVSSGPIEEPENQSEDQLEEPPKMTTIHLSIVHPGGEVEEVDSANPPIGLDEEVAIAVEAKPADEFDSALFDTKPEDDNP